MKLHLPVKLFRALMALALIAPFTSQAGVIPADYTLQWGDSVETVMNQSEATEDIAFIVNTDLTFSGGSPVASGESGSRIFIDKSTDDIAQKLSFSGFSSQIFDYDGDLTFSDFGELSISSNNFETEEQRYYSLINLNWENTLSFDNIDKLHIGSNSIRSTEDYDAYAYGVINAGQTNFKSCDEIKLSGNYLQLGNWDSFPTYIEYSGGSVIQGEAYFEDNKDIFISANSISGRCYVSSLYGGAVHGNVEFRRNRDITFSGNGLNGYTGFAYSNIGGGAIYTSYDVAIFEGNRNISFANCYVYGSESNAHTGTDHVYARGGAVYGGIFMKNNHDINYSDNNVTVHSSTFSYAEGGAVYSGLELVANNDITICNNYVSSYCYQNYYHYANGGAIYGSLILNANKNINISGNYARSSGSINLSGAVAQGGAVNGSLILQNNHNVSVSGNHIEGFDEYSRGGAVYGYVDISGNHNVVFENNYERYVSWADEEMIQTKSDFLLRSIYDEYSASTLSSPTGCSVTFYDTIYVGGLTINADYTDINGETQISGGDVIFSGAKTEEHLKELINRDNNSEDELIPTAEQIAASRHSQVNGDVQVEGGRLLITDKAVLSVTGTTTVRNGATLAIKGGQFEGGVVMSDDCHLELSFSAENADKPLINGYVDWRAVGTFDEGYNYGDYIETNPIALKLGLADVDTPDGRYLLISEGVDIYNNGLELTGMDGWIPDADNLYRDENALVYDYVRTVWNGTDGSSWDTYTQNWTQGEEACYYEEGAPTIFEDKGAGTVYINEEINPGFVLVKNSEGYDYTWEGSGYGLSGKMSLTKRGDGILTINNANTYSGNTYVEGGTLIVANENALGTGTVYLKDAKLQLNASLPNKLTTSGTSYVWVEGWNSKLQSTIINNGELEIGGWNGCLDVSALELKKKASFRINENNQMVTNSESGYQVTGGYEVIVVEGNPLGITDEEGNNYGLSWDGVIHDGYTYKDEYDYEYHERLTLCEDGIARGGGKVDYSTYYLTGENDSYSAQEAGKKVVMDSGYLSLYLDAEVQSTGGQIVAWSTWLSNTVALTGFIEDTHIQTDSIHLTLDATLSGSTSLYISTNGDVTINGNNTYTGGTDISRATVIINNANALGEGRVYLGSGGKLYTNGYEIENDITTNGGVVIGSIRLNGDKTLTIGTEGMTLEGGLTIDGGIININGGVLEVGELLNIEDGAPAQVNVSYHYLFDAEGDVVLMQFNGPIRGNAADAFSYTGGGELRFDEESGTVSLTLGDKQTWVGGKKDSWMNGSAIGWDNAQPFVAGNRTVFNSAGSVNISGEVAPSAVLVDVAKSFSFKNKYDKKTSRWSGAIVGSASVTKRGKGTLTLNDGNTYSGGTYIEAGTVAAAGASSFGSGAITISGGTLDMKSKAVANAITLSDSAAVKGGKKYLGTYTQTGGELMKGSVLNVAESATISGGVVNGTLSGVGTVTIDGEVELGVSGKLTTAGLSLAEDARLTVSSKGMVMNSKTSVIDIQGGSLTSEGKISAASLQMNGGDIEVVAAKAQSLSLNDKLATNSLYGANIHLGGKMSVAGNLVIDGVSQLHLFDPSTKNKAQSLAVKGSLDFGGGSSLRLNGALSAKDLTLGSGTLTLCGAKLSTIKVGNSLTLEGGTTLNLGFNVTEKDVAKGKAFKVFTFKTIDESVTDATLNELLGLGTDAATLAFDTKRKAITLTVTDAAAWNAYAESVRTGEIVAAASEDDVLVESAGAQVLVAPAAVDPLLGKVADTLVQSTWGTAGASRAFADTIAARGTHATALADGKGAAWISTMGGSSRLSSDGAHAGADYTLTGAAFGMEARLSEKSTVGLAIGNSWGKVSTFSAFPVDQDSTHQGIYGKHLLGSSTTLSWMAAHTRTESDANLAGMACDWTQDALQLDARVDKLFAISDRTTVSAFVGMQYLATDKGECNGLSTGSLQNLRGEIGVSAAHKATDRTYVYGELSFIGDMVRHNPTATVGDYRSRGANPGRAGLNLSVGGSYQLNDSWSLNASYNLELMQNQTSHSANVGATYSF